MLLLAALALQAQTLPRPVPPNSFKLAPAGKVQIVYFFAPG